MRPTICTYTLNFVDSWDGKKGGAEFKCFETADWKPKWKLLVALHPDWERQVVK